MSEAFDFDNYEVQDEKAAKLQRSLEKFDEDCRTHNQKLVQWQAFWRDAIENGIDVPYNAADSVWNRLINVAVHKPYDSALEASPLDVEETQKVFSRIMKWA